MNFIGTALQGLYIIEPTTVSDERGTFMRVFCKKDFAEIGHEKEFVHFNHSINKVKGSVRGMHLQKSPHAEIKLVRCIKGSAFDVAIDVRPSSSTFLKWHGEIISADNKKSMYIPEGFAHGFQILEVGTELLYHHTEYYMPDFEMSVNALDKRVGIKWPLGITLMSDKDKAIPMLG